MTCRVRSAPAITRSPVRTTFSPLRFEIPQWVYDAGLVKLGQVNGPGQGGQVTGSGGAAGGIIAPPDGPMAAALGSYIAALADQLNQNMDRIRSAFEAAARGTFENYTLLPYTPGVGGGQAPPGTRAPDATAIQSQSFVYLDDIAVTSGDEEVALQFVLDGAAFTGPLVANFAALFSSEAGPGIARLYVGGSFVDRGDPPSGGTLLAAVVVPSGGFAALRLTDSFTRPTGIVPLQITLESSGSGNACVIRNACGLVRLAT